MAETFKPTDAGGIEAAVQWALSHDAALDVAGGGSKRGIGRHVDAAATLDLSGLSGVTLYEPSELVLSARAGTPLSEIEALVAASGQHLAFEPVDYAAVFGEAPGRGTVGGALAANHSGPRRIQSGAARDHFLGASAVSGRGEIFKAGGRVVKNVTGYDLCKLLAGSFGTLAVMTDVTLKVMPRPETEETILILGLSDIEGVRAMTAVMGSPCEVSGAAHLPADIALRTPAALHRTSVTAFRLEGVAPSVAHRKLAIETLLHAFGADFDVSTGAESQALWKALRDAAPFAATGAAERPLWRISTAPAGGAALAAMVRQSIGAQMFYDWAGGLLWVECLPAEDGGAAAIRAAVRACGGHATLIRAADAVRAAVDVFEAEEPHLAALSRRVKAAFDPRGVLNPGRMWAGV